MSNLSIGSVVSSSLPFTSVMAGKSQCGSYCVISDTYYL